MRKPIHSDYFFHHALRYFVPVLCLLVVVSCKKDDPVPENEDEEIEVIDYVIPTEDEVAVKSPFGAYISPSVTSEDFSGALHKRMIYQLPVLDEHTVEDLVTVIIHNSDVARLRSDEDLMTAIIFQLLIGGNVVIVEPTLEAFNEFCTIITTAYQLYFTGEEGEALLEACVDDCVPGARRMFEVFHQMSIDRSKIVSLFALDSDKEGILAEAVGIRGSSFHVVNRLDDVVTGDGETYHEEMDENGEVTIVENPVVEEENPEVNNDDVSDHTYGLTADMLTAWINDHEYYYEDFEESKTRSLPELQRATRAENKCSLTDIANVQKVEYTISAQSPSNISPNLPVLMRFEVCSVYIEAEDCDYYCIYKNIRSYNQVLDCGPREKREWRKNANFGYWYKPSDRHPLTFVKYQYYGPFLRNIFTENACYAATESIDNDSSKITELLDTDEVKALPNARVEEYAPKNSIGSVDKMTGFSFGLNGGLSFGTDTSVGVGMNFSYNSSTTQTIKDLEIRAASYDGVPAWEYIGHNLPISSFNLVLKAAHTAAPNVLQRECEVDQSWIWRVSNPTGLYCLYDKTEVVTSAMYVDDFWVYTRHRYINRSNVRRASFLMLPPPRVKQVWVRDVVPFSAEVNELLGTLHEKYWDSSNYEVSLADTSEDSTLSVTQFINDFKRDLEDKKMIWRNRGMVPANKKYTFYFYKKGSDKVEQFDFKF